MASAAGTRDPSPSRSRSMSPGRRQPAAASAPSVEAEPSTFLTSPASASPPAIASPTEPMPVQRILVALRKRPRLGPTEISEADVVTVEEERSSVAVREPKISVDGTKVSDQRGSFTFDYAFDETSSNAKVYMQTVKPHLDVARKGGSAVFFAYGQTGSGKTHTMMGSGDGSEHGMYALAARDIISQLRGMRLSVSFYEIYGGKLFDLLNGRSPIQTLEDEHKFLHLVGLTDHPISDHNALLELMKLGSAQRSSGSTHVNDRSSRSHAVLVFYVKLRREPRIHARISFIDLAGSERAADTLDLDKKTRAEGAEINRSLLALKECVRAMYARKRHIPFRGSKLTQVLRDSFQGNGVTVMIANVSPCLVHTDDTVNTLKYTDRIKEMHESPSGGLVADPTQSVEPELCEKCGFPILVDARELHVCPKQYVPCKYCKMEIVKDKLTRHHEVCLEVPVSCADCGLRATRGQMVGHAEKCPSATFTCPLCAKQVPRRQRETHAATDCPEVKKPCPHCRVQMKRRELATHMKQCPQRQVLCPQCGFLVKQGNQREHNRTCFGGTTTSRGTAHMPPTPSKGKLPPIHHERTQSGVTPTKSGLADSMRPSSAGTAATATELSTSTKKGAATARGAKGSSTRKSGATKASSTKGTTPRKPRAKKATPKKAARPEDPLTADAAADPDTSAADPAVSTIPPAHRDRSPIVELNRDQVDGERSKPTPQPPVARPTSASARSAQLASTDSRDTVIDAGAPKGPAPPGGPPPASQRPTSASPRPDELVPCPFAGAGCTARLRQADLDEHISSSVTGHLMLVHSQSLELQRENQELRSKLGSVERQVQEKRIGGSPVAEIAPPIGRAGQPRTPPAKRESNVLALDEKRMSGRSKRR